MYRSLRVAECVGCCGATRAENTRVDAASTSEDGELKGARGEMVRRVGRDDEGEEEGGGGE